MTLILHSTQKEEKAQYHLLPLRIGTMYNLYYEGHKGQLSLVLVPLRIFTPLKQ